MRRSQLQIALVLEQGFPVKLRNDAEFEVCQLRWLVPDDESLLPDGFSAFEDVAFIVMLGHSADVDQKRCMHVFNGESKTSG